MSNGTEPINIGKKLQEKSNALPSSSSLSKCFHRVCTEAALTEVYPSLFPIPPFQNVELLNKQFNARDEKILTKRKINSGKSRWDTNFFILEVWTSFLTPESFQLPGVDEVIENKKLIIKQRQSFLVSVSIAGLWYFSSSSGPSVVVSSTSFPFALCVSYFTSHFLFSPPGYDIENFAKWIWKRFFFSISKLKNLLSAREAKRPGEIVREKREELEISWQMDFDRKLLLPSNERHEAVRSIKLDVSSHACECTQPSGQTTESRSRALLNELKKKEKRSINFLWKTFTTRFSPTETAQVPKSLQPSRIEMKLAWKNAKTVSCELSRVKSTAAPPKVFLVFYCFHKFSTSSHRFVC